MRATEENAFKTDSFIWYNTCIFLNPSFKRTVKI